MLQYRYEASEAGGSSMTSSRRVPLRQAEAPPQATFSGTVLRLGTRLRVLPGLAHPRPAAQLVGRPSGCGVVCGRVADLVHDDLGHRPVGPGLVAGPAIGH